MAAYNACFQSSNCCSSAAAASSARIYTIVDTALLLAVSISIVCSIISRVIPAIL